MCERNINGLPFIPSTGDLACNPGMCSDWESNQTPFGLQNNAQPTESHQPGLQLFKTRYLSTTLQHLDIIILTMILYSIIKIFQLNLSLCVITINHSINNFEQSLYFYCSIHNQLNGIQRINYAQRILCFVLLNFFPPKYILLAE